MPKPDWTRAYHQCLPTDARTINGQTMYVIEGVPQLNTFFCGEFVRDDVTYHLVYCIRDINEPIVDHPIIDGVQFAQHVDYMPRHADIDKIPSGLLAAVAGSADPYGEIEATAALYEPSRLGRTWADVVSAHPDIIQPTTATDPETGETWTRDNVWRCNLEQVA